MKNTARRNTYQSITLWHYDNSTDDFARLYVHVVDAKLKTHAAVSYEDGKKIMAQLMLRLGRLPEIRHHDEGDYSFTVYDLHDFID